MNLQDFKKRAFSKASFKKEYERYDLAFEIGQMIVEARILKGVTQEKLAKLINTKQPSIARLEGGKMLPSLSFLKRIANALGTYLLAPKFAFLEQHEISLIASRSDTSLYRPLAKNFRHGAGDLHVLNTSTIDTVCAISS